MGDMNAVFSLISNVGFPIAAFIAMFWMTNTTLKDLKSVITENTTLLTELSTKINTVAKEGITDGKNDS